MCPASASVAAAAATSDATYLSQVCGTLKVPLPSHFGEFGGKFAPETLMAALDELETLFVEAVNDPLFHAELADLNVSWRCNLGGGG